MIIKRIAVCTIIISLLLTGITGCSTRDTAKKPESSGSSNGQKDTVRDNKNVDEPEVPLDPNASVSHDVSQRDGDYPKEVEQMIEVNKEQPSIQFVKASGMTYIAVFMGMQPTAGYSVELVKAEESKDYWNVDVVFKKPAKDMFVAQVITYPYIVLKNTSDKTAKVTVRDHENNKVIMEKTII